ncbi:methyltransferase family protein [Granulicella arctica]|uniref:methyltransferase family protein n=1 Tax=Granulicella arctica TaxID=940613 RepID=UPI0021E0E7BC|nr:methyltransferase [Granulicella arctica]
MSLEALREGNCWFCEHCGEHWEEVPTEAMMSDAEASSALVNAQSEDDAFDDKRKQLRKRRSKRRTVILVTIAAVAVAAWNVQLPWTPLRWVALTLWTCSQILWTIARWQLGSSFTPMTEARQLVTDGLYSRIQNPIYLFRGVSLASLVIYLDKSWLLLGLLVLVPIQVQRIRAERKTLFTAFRIRYFQYSKKTWF